MLVGKIFLQNYLKIVDQLSVLCKESTCSSVMLIKIQNKVIFSVRSTMSLTTMLKNSENKYKLFD